MPSKTGSARVPTDDEVIRKARDIASYFEGSGDAQPRLSIDGDGSRRRGAELLVALGFLRRIDRPSISRADRKQHTLDTSRYPEGELKIGDRQTYVLADRVSPRTSIGEYARWGPRTSEDLGGEIWLRRHGMTSLPGALGFVDGQFATAPPVLSQGPIGH